MEGGTYSFIYPGLSASDGGQIDPWKKDSLAYPYDSQAQISEEVAQVGSLSRRGVSADADIQAFPSGLSPSLLPVPGPIRAINGGGATYPESVPPV
jgi:hypothetical protein